MHAIGCIQRMLGSAMNECVCCIMQEEILHLGIYPKYRGNSVYLSTRVYMWGLLGDATLMHWSQPGLGRVMPSATGPSLNRHTPPSTTTLRRSLLCNHRHPLPFAAGPPPSARDIFGNMQNISENSIHLSNILKNICLEKLFSKIIFPEILFLGMKIKPPTKRPLKDWLVSSFLYLISTKSQTKWYMWAIFLKWVI